ncbi:hypothetical protein VNO78_30441 [Psophocarpus tetragonolobus]|uniref:CRC domain-containing protein n=1 Tax=Psophocarpus tetragonolobus TaxID=3891 RepID=A0AAN9RX26_PSOTE
MMMNSPEPSKNNNGTSSASNNNNNNDATSSESPQLQDSPYFRYVATLSPLPFKASHSSRSFAGPSSPIRVFKSPRISHHESQLTERRIQSLNGVQSQIENGGNSLGEDPENSRKSNSQQSLPERFITDTQKVFDSENDANAEHYSPTSSVDDFLADPGNIDQMYLAEKDMEQCTDAAEISPSDPTQSKKNISKFDRTDGPGDKAEDSNKVHQEKAVYGEEPEKVDEGKKDVEWASQEPSKLESILAAHASKKQYSHDPLPQDVKGCEDYSENILQDSSKATLNYHGISRRCLQFGEAASNALGSNKSHVKLNATSNNMKTVMPSEPVTSLCPQQRSSGNFPLIGPKPSGIGLHLNSIIIAIPAGQAATTGVKLPDGSQGMNSTPSIRLQRIANVKRSLLSSNVDGQSPIDIKNENQGFVATVTDAENSELNEPPSPSKKKIKTSVAANNNGRKHCNCKKSKCVKLYCECFVAGNYCIDLCGCQDCTNRLEYAETVTETKQQIESRNADAFTPKVISSNNMANVGCSSACRCEECKNSYGKREDYVAYERTSSTERMSSSVAKESDCTFHSELDKVVGNTAYDQHRLSLITPSFQCSDQGKETSEYRVISANCLHSPGSDVNMFASSANYTKSSENFHSTHALLQTSEMLGTAPYDPQIERNNVMLLHPTPPLFNSVQSGASLASFVNEWRNISQSQLPGEFINQLLGSDNSLNWHSSSSSHTPNTAVGEAQYLLCPESSDSRLFKNEIPDILKEVSTPVISVKVNSPTQKRISPPQSRQYGIGSSSSGGFRNSRKFILEGVPNFPSLSPCVDSKGNGNGDLGNSQSK